MAVCRSGSTSSAPSSRLGATCCCLLLLVLGMGAVRVAVAAEAVPLGAKCDFINACRAGVANDACCRAIDAAIYQGTCSCACRQLAIFGYRNLAADCSSKAGCPRCRYCKCTKLSDEPASVSGL